MTTTDRRTFAISMIAMIAALLAAWGPANSQRTSYDWPTVTKDPAGELGGAELLLARHDPAELSVTVPCDNGVAGLIFKTAWNPAEVGGLMLTTDGSSARLSVGPSEVASLPSCGWTLIVEERQWAVSADGESISSGVFAEGPVVSGLFAPSTLIDGDGAPIRVTVTTFTHGSTPTLSQWVLISISLLGCALVVADLGRRRHRGPAVDSPRFRPRVEDAVVVGALAIWTIVGPPLLDDGWILQIVTHRDPGGVFRNYHDFWDAALALGFFHESIYWLATQVSSQFIFARLVSLMLVIGGWFILRVGLRTIVPHRSRLAWAAAAMLTITFGMAWMISLRAEPLVALCSVLGLAALIRFRSEPDAFWLLCGGLAAAVAVTVHPSGLVAASPLVVSAPAVLRWVRTLHIRAWAFATAATTSAAVTVLLLFADTDIRLWNVNRQLLASAPIVSEGWRDEGKRYSLLFTSVYDTVVRRASVLSAVVVILLFALSWQRRRSSVSVLPTAALATSMMLLMATPSKWPWHFGSIGLLAAAAMATELHVLAKKRVAGPGHFVAIASFVIIGAIAWKGQEIWTAYLSGYGRTSFLQVAGLASSPLAWAGVAGLLVLLGRARRLSSSESIRLCSLVLPVVVLGTMVFSTGARFVAMLIVDPQSTGGQNVAAILGRGECGLGPVVMIDDPTQATSSPIARVDISFVGDPTDLPALGDGVDGAFEVEPRPAWAQRVSGTRLNGDDDVGWVSTPWQLIPAGTNGLFAGVIGRVDDENDIVLQRGVVDDGEVRVVEESRVDVEHQEERWTRLELARWDAEPGTVARLVLRDRAVGALGWLAVSDITTVPTTSLQAIADEGATILIDPFFRTSFPCIIEPPLDRGIAVEPDLVIGATPIQPSSAPFLVGDIRFPTQILATVNGDRFVQATQYERRTGWSDSPVSVSGAPEN